MMYRDPDAAADLGEPSRRPPGPRARVRVQRLERRRRRRLRRRCTFIGSPARRDALRAPRPRGVLRLPGRRGRRSSSSTGVTRAVEWPEVEVWAAHAPRAPRDLVLVSGPEPSMRWRTFCDGDRRARRGARRAAHRHARRAAGRRRRTRARCRSSASRATTALVERLGLSPTSYEGPTGITGVLYTACQDAGLPSASLWASVPHYVAAAPNPKASLALVRKLESLVGVSVDASDLETGAAEYERQRHAGRLRRRRRAAVRRAPRAGRRRGGAVARAAGRPVRRRARARVPALPLAAPAARGLSSAVGRGRRGLWPRTRGEPRAPGRRAPRHPPVRPRDRGALHQAPAEPRGEERQPRARRAGAARTAPAARPALRSARMIGRCHR